MTVTIDVKYVAGRVHGTPWGISHNEGAVEFPPSPWRILRALVATWYERVPDIPESVVRELIESLARSSPSYEVPRFSTAHARHYFPDSSHKKGASTSTAKVLDAFAAVDPKTPLRIHWDVELSEPLFDALSQLARALPHLGRAESLVDAAVRTHPAPLIGNDSRRVGVDYASGSNHAIRLLSPTIPFSWDELLGIPWKLRQKGFVRPPGSELVGYGSDEPLEWKRALTTATVYSPPIKMVEWRFKGKGRIPLTAAVGYADLLRKAIQHQFTDGGVPWQISGHSAEGTPLSSNHRHGFLLPIVDTEPSGDGSHLDQSNDRFLLGFGYFFPDALEHEFERFLTAPRRLQPRNEAGNRDLREVSIFLQSVGPVNLQLPAFQRAKVWRTVTPYAPSRHIRSDARMMRSLMSEVNRDLVEKGQPEATEVQFSDGHHHRALAFRRHRVAEKLSEGRRAFHLQIQFADEVSGPISLGALAHFGLGHFVPLEPSPTADRFTTVRM
jgi:CRISPR-associated protein Csb2